MLAGRRLVALEGHRRVAEGVGYRMMVRPVGVVVVVSLARMTVVVVRVMAMGGIRSGMGVIVMRRGSLRRRRVGAVGVVLMGMTVRGRRGVVIVLR